MPSAHVWSGQEIRQLQRFGEILDLANRLVGRDDYLANLLLEDALAELRGVLGQQARPLSRLRKDQR